MAGIIYLGSAAMSGSAAFLVGVSVHASGMSPVAALLAGNAMGLSPTASKVATGILLISTCAIVLRMVRSRINEPGAIKNLGAVDAFATGGAVCGYAAGALLADAAGWYAIGGVLVAFFGVPALAFCVAFS